MKQHNLHYLRKVDSTAPSDSYTMQKLEQSDLIRRYLLRDLDEERLEQIEERLLADEGLQADLSDAQDKLIDDYAFGMLTKRECTLFKKNFLLTPERLHKLRFSKALAKYTETDVANAQGIRASAVSTSWQKLFYWLQKYRIAVATSAALILLIIGYSGWSIYRRRQLGNRLAMLQIQQLKAEQELARLNTGPLPEQQTAIVTLPLKQLLVRDTNEMRRAVITDGINILQLKLELNEDEFPVYQAVIETDEGIGIYTINDLRSKSVGEDKTVFLNLPSRLLPPGSYRVHLNGITADNKLIDIGRYSFQVVFQ